MLRARARRRRASGRRSAHYVAASTRDGVVETRDLARAVEEATGRNLDRFFEQWVFKAGHPELKIETSWDAEQKLAKLAVTQTQTVEGDTPLFHFPPPVRFVVDGAAHDVTLTVSAAAESFVVPLGAEPTQVILDPGNNLLKTLDEKKADELWTAQLAHAARAIDRVRAARALGKAGSPTATEALARSMAADPSWTVRGEAGLALGALKTEAARDALAAAVGAEAHPKARRALVKALGDFRNDERAADALEPTLARDASYFVEAESAMSLAKTRSPRAFDKLVAAMTRPSYLDVIQSMCLSGMAELRDERGIEIALEAARYGKPVIGRRAAIAALGALGAEHAQHKRRVRETLVELLDDRDFRARIAAVEALRVLGDPEAVDALGRAERKDLDGRVRRRAREVARKLAEGSAQDEQLHSLRDAVEKLQDENRELKERLMKLEARK